MKEANLKMKSLTQNQDCTINHRDPLAVMKRLSRTASGSRFLSVGVAIFLALRGWAGPGDLDPAFSVPPVAGGFPTTVSLWRSSRMAKSCWVETSQPYGELSGPVSPG